MHPQDITRYSARQLNRYINGLSPEQFSGWTTEQLSAARHVAERNPGRRLGWPPLALSFTLVLGIAAGQGLQLWKNPVVFSVVLLLCLMLGSVLGNLARLVLGASDAEFLAWRLQSPGDLGRGELPHAELLLDHPACAAYSARLQASGRPLVRHDMLFMQEMRRSWVQGKKAEPLQA